MHIPFLRPPFNTQDRAAAYKAMLGSNVSTGPEIYTLEYKFAQYIKCKSALSVCNGSIALDLILQTYLRAGILKKKDTVLLPSFTFASVANSVVNAGLTPIFCDVDRGTWNIDILSAHKYQDLYRLGAIIAVHTFGNPCNMESIVNLSNEFDALLIEDCAEACGASFHGAKVGSFGHAATFSFNATKNMTTGEGGMVCFNDDDPTIALKARMLKENGFGHTPRNVELPGYNYRMDNIKCAIGLSQLKTLDARNQKRRINAHCLASMMEYVGLEGKIIPQTIYGDNKNAFQIFGMLVNDRDKVYDHLIKSGIEAKKYFSPAIHTQKYYHHNFVIPKLKNTDYVADHIICLPFDDKLTTEEMVYMVERIQEVIR